MKKVVRTINKQCAQGELHIVKVDAIDPSLSPREVEPNDGRFIVGHSESGHHHSVRVGPDPKESRVKFLETNDPFVCYLQVDAEYADLEHEKDAPPAHGTARLPQGLYRINRQTEWLSPEQRQRVMD